MSQYIGVTTAYLAATVGGLYLAIQDEMKDDRATSRYQFDYQMRGPQYTNEQYGFFSGWTTSRYGNLDPDMSGLEGNVMVGLDCATGHSGWDYSYEVSSLGNSGTLRPYYIKGQVIDSNSNPVNGATVECYVVGGNGPGQDLFIASAVTNSSGYYAIPTQFSTSNHYLVATYGSTAGTTLQTILPSA